MNKRNNRGIKRIGLLLTAALLAFGLLPAAAFGADAISLSHTAGFDAIQGDGVYIEVESKVLSGTSDYSLTLTSSDSDITVISGSTGVFSGGTDQTATFTVKVDRKASVGEHTLTVQAIADDGAGTVINARDITLDVARSQDSFSSRAARPLM